MTDPREIRQAEAAEQAASSEQPSDRPVDTGEAAPAGRGDAEAAAAPSAADSTAGGEQTDAVPDDGRSRGELLGALAKVERQRDDYVDYLRRERAEFENYRKRSARERLETLDRGAEKIVRSLLGVLDNFSLALDAAEGSDDEALAKGVQMVHNEFLAALTNAGLEEIPGQGVPFDPEQHEAMMQVDAVEELGREVDEPVVAEVLRRGYRFKGRVLRPASVKVAH